MSYLVFARKYRPQTFDEVVSQEHVTRTLRNALKNDRIASGYLFCGPRGTGKTTVARLLAKAINCVNGPTDNPCGVCPACVEIASGSSLDVLEIDAASNTGVDDIRTLRENVRYLPTGGKKRIYIIDEVHRLSGSAFDALLKTLEEPPPHVIFIFATTEPLKVPETILSRTQRFDFKRVTVDDLAAHLHEVSQKEGLNINDAALTLLARKADGSVRDSLSLLDQIAAFAGNSVTEQDVVNALGLVDRKFLFDYIEAVAAHDPRAVLHLVRQIVDGGVDPSDFISELLDHFRTLLILNSDPEPGELISITGQDLDDYRKQAGYFSVGDLLRLVKITSDLNADLKSGLDERLLLEVAAVKMAELESTIRLQEVLEALRTASAAGSGSAQAGQTPDFFRPAPPVKAAVTGNAATQVEKLAGESLPLSGHTLNLPQVNAGWEGFLTAFRRSSPMLASQLRMAEVRSVKDNEISATFYASGEASLHLVTKPENLGLITKLLREHFRANVTIRFDIDRTKEHPNPPGDGTTVNRVDTQKLVEQSPRLKKLLEKVNGEIIGVKRVK